MSNCGACDSQEYCPTHRPAPYGASSPNEQQVQCPECNGTGKRTQTTNQDGEIVPFTLACIPCNGTGYVTPDNAMSGSMSPNIEPADEVVATNKELTNMIARLAKVVEGQAERIKNIEEHLNG